MEKLNKVARITFLFWIIKIFATTIGETLGDMFSMTLGIGYLQSLIITFILFAISLLIQLKVSKFYTGLYWLVIIGTTTVGTEISDFMDRTLGLGYASGSLILFSSLMLVLFIWHRYEKGIKYYPITNVKVETLFWIAVLLSNSLGTAFGDFLSDNVGLSYLNGAMITAGIIVIVVVLHYFSKINHILLFWIAFIFTRPFGATFGDLLTKPIDKGGLDLGTIPSTLITAILMIIIVIYSSIKENGLSIK
ncbi:MAG: hypothetical protein HXX18_06235 [Bacteroidetes bacterium]|nr:hypothetical protein [Bacteroidota bacterium]